jgi:hypothetical protein
LQPPHNPHLPRASDKSEPLTHRNQGWRSPRSCRLSDSDAFRETVSSLEVSHLDIATSHLPTFTNSLRQLAHADSTSRLRRSEDAELCLAGRGR